MATIEERLERMLEQGKKIKRGLPTQQGTVNRKRADTTPKSTLSVEERLERMSAQGKKNKEDANALQNLPTITAAKVKPDTPLYVAEIPSSSGRIITPYQALLNKMQLSDTSEKAYVRAQKSLAQKYSQSGAFGGGASSDTGGSGRGFGGERERKENRVKNTLYGAAARSVGDVLSALGTGMEYAENRVYNKPASTVLDIQKESGNVNELVRRAAEDEKKRTADGLKAAGKVRDLGRSFGQYGNEEIERAKDGLGGLGRFAVDVGAGGAQMAGDIAASMLTGNPGGALVPMAIRTFGGGADEAAQEGASLKKQVQYGIASALLETATEKLGSLGNIQTKAFGSGAMDEVLEGVVAAVERLGKTDAGKAVLNRLGSAGVGFVSEGAEEFVSGILQPLIKRGIYSDEPVNWKDTVSEAAYEFLVGGGIGAISGGIGGTDTGSFRQAREGSTAENSTAEALQQAQEPSQPQGNIPASPETRTLLNGSQTAQEGIENPAPNMKAGVNPRSDGITVEPGFHAGKLRVDQRTAGKLDAIGKAIGARIELVPAGTREGYNGWQSGGNIYISEDAESPVLEVARHELTHRMQELAPDEYRAYRDYVEKINREDGVLNHYLTAIQENYAGEGTELTREQALDEMAANYAQQLFTDEDAAKRLAMENRGLFQRMLDWLKNLVNKIKSAFTKKGGGKSGQDTDIHELEQAETLWENALKAAGEAHGASIREQNRLGSFWTAERMAERGYDPDTIAERTGWRQDASGKWREAEAVTAETRNSIRYDQSNRPFVTVEEDILDGVPKLRWIKTVKDNLRQKFPNGVTVGRNQIKINSTTRNELTKSDSAEWYRKNAPQVYQDKLKATNNLDEILTASRDYINEPPKHERNDNITDFGRGTVQLRIGGKDYTAEVVVGNTTGGNMVMYDLVKLKETEIPDIKKPNAEFTDQSHKAERSVDSSTPTQSAAPAFSDESIPRITEEVNPDESRKSQKGSKSLQEEVELLRRQNKRLKEEFQRGVARPDPSELSKRASSVLEAYDSGYNHRELTDRLDALYRDIAAHATGTAFESAKAPPWSELRETARGIARDILSNSQTQQNELYEEYSELRKELRTRAVKLAEDDRGDITDGYADFRRSHFGRLKISENGSPVDTVYAELNEKYPEFFPEDITHPADQLQRMGEVADELRSVLGNPYEDSMDSAVEFLSGELMEMYYDAPEKSTYADRAAQARAKRDIKLRKLKEKHRLQNLQRTENQNAAQRRETIRRHAKRLSTSLLKPTDKLHVPEELRGAAAELLGSIDTGSGYEVLTDENGKRRHVDPGTPGAEPTKRSEAAQRLRKAYEELKDTDKGNMTIDPDLAGFLDEISEMWDTPLDNMTKAQLDTVWKALRAVETSISQSGKMLAASKFQTVSGMAEAIRQEAESVPQRAQFSNKLLGKAVGGIDKLVNLDMLTPETYFHKLGAGGDDLWAQFRRAQNKEIEIKGDALQFFEKAYEESGLKKKKLTARELERETRDFELSGGKTTLTTAQIMELYVLNKREQAREHLFVGGIRPEKVQGVLFAKGRVGAVKITEADVGTILDALTPEEKALADKLQGYLSTELSQQGNDASLRVYGYKKFTEENYWPIHVGQADTRSDPVGAAESKTIPGYGMTKQVKPHASNPVELHSIFNTFAEHVTQMSTYAAWLDVNENATRVLNFQYRDTDGSVSGTVKDMLERVHGEGGRKYLENLLTDIAQGTKAKQDTGFSVENMTRAFKSSAVAGNLRVILQQPTAIFRAMETLTPSCFLNSKSSPLRGWEKAKKYAKIAQWKDWGYFEMDTGKSLRELMTGPETALGKVNDAFMWGAGKADAVGWGMLWNAVETETARNRKDLTYGSGEFYKAVADRFGEIIDRTQVVDSVLHRSQNMRSGNALTKMATSFMSEPVKQFNEVERAFYDVNRAFSKNQGKQKAVKQLVRTAGALTLSFLVNAIFQSVPDAWRDKDRDKSYREKFLGHFSENFLSNFNPVGYVPYLRDLGSVIEGYDVARMDMEVAGDIVAACRKMMDAWSGSGKASKASATLDFTAQICRLLNLPLPTVKKDALGITGSIMQAAKDYEGLYNMDKFLFNVESPGNRAQFAGDLRRAMDKNWEDYRAIYSDLKAHGLEDDKIKSSIEKQMLDALSEAVSDYAGEPVDLDSTALLPYRWSPPGENQEFDQLMRKAAKEGKSWAQVLPKDELEAVQAQAALDGAKKNDKIQELAGSPWDDKVKERILENVLSDSEWEQFQATRKAGISILRWAEVYDDALYARKKRTGKDGGTPSQEDVRTALNKSRLTEAQKKAFWDGYGWEKEWGE